MLLIVLEEYRTDIRAKELMTAKGKRRRSGNFFGNGTAGSADRDRPHLTLEGRQGARTQALGLGLKRFQQLGRHLLPFRAKAAFERDHLTVDKIPYRLLYQSYFFRQLKVHFRPLVRRTLSHHRTYYLFRL